MKRSSSAGASAASQRAVSNGASSKPTATSYSAAIRAASTSSCKGPTTPTIGCAPEQRPEHLGHALLGQIVERAPELLGPDRILEADPAQDLRGEARDADEAQLLALGQRVADPQRAVVRDADDVARPGLLGELALLREEEDRAVDRDGLAGARLAQLHAAAEAARADAHERHPVAVVGVHVGLDLEHEARDRRLLRPDRAGLRRLRARRRRRRREAAEQRAHRAVLERAAEVDRRQMARAVGIEIGLRIDRERKLGGLAEAVERLAVDPLG